MERGYRDKPSVDDTSKCFLLDMIVHPYEPIIRLWCFINRLNNIANDEFQKSPGKRNKLCLFCSNFFEIFFRGSKIQALLQQDKLSRNVLFRRFLPLHITQCAPSRIMINTTASISRIQHLLRSTSSELPLYGQRYQNTF